MPLSETPFGRRERVPSRTPLAIMRIMALTAVLLVTACGGRNTKEASYETGQWPQFLEDRIRRVAPDLTEEEMILLERGIMEYKTLTEPEWDRFKELSRRLEAQMGSMRDIAPDIGGEGDINIWDDENIVGPQDPLELEGGDGGAETKRWNLEGIDAWQDEDGAIWFDDGFSSPELPPDIERREDLGVGIIILDTMRSLLISVYPDYSKDKIELFVKVLTGSSLSESELDEARELDTEGIVFPKTNGFQWEGRMIA